MEVERQQYPSEINHQNAFNCTNVINMGKVIFGYRLNRVRLIVFNSGSFFDDFSEDLRGTNPPVDWVFFGKSSVFFLKKPYFFPEISQFFSKFLCFPQNSPGFSQKISNFCKYCLLLLRIINILVKFLVFGSEFFFASGFKSLRKAEYFWLKALSFFGTQFFWELSFFENVEKKACV